VLIAALGAWAGAQDAPDVAALEARAQHAIAAGDTEAAVAAYAALRTAEPEQPRWVAGAAEAMARGGRFNDALDLLEDARRRLPAVLQLQVLQAKVHMLKAESLASGGRRDSYVLFAYEDAAALARQVLAKDEDNRDARLIVAEAEYSLGNADAAVSHARAAIQRFPDHPGGHILIAKVMYQRFVAAKQRIAGEQLTGKALEQASIEAAAARKAATTALEEAVRADPGRAFPHKLLGDVHAWNGNLAQARISYGKALGIDPQVGVDHAWLAKNTPPEALVELYRTSLAAYQQRPDTVPARAAVLVWYLGKALFDRRQFAAAHETMLAALRANPEFLNALHYVWLASYWTGDLDTAAREAAAYARQNTAAFADLLRGLSDRAQTLPILGALAARAYEARHLDDSCSINHVLALVENSTAAWNNFAFLCREVGRFADSLAGYEHALELEPESPQLLNDAAVILHYHLASPDNLARAREMYQRAIALATAKLDTRGLADDERKRVEQARQDARSNLAKLPGH